MSPRRDHWQVTLEDDREEVEGERVWRVGWRGKDEGGRRRGEKRREGRGRRRGEGREEKSGGGKKKMDVGSDREEGGARN